MAKKVAVAVKAESRSSEYVASVVEKVALRHSHHSRSWRFLRRREVPVAGMQRTVVGDIADLIPGAAVVAKKYLGTTYSVVVVQDWGMVVMAVDTDLEAEHTIVDACQSWGRVLGSRHHIATAVVHMRLKGLHFLCSSSRLTHLVLLTVVCLGTGWMPAVV